MIAGGWDWLASTPEFDAAAGPGWAETIMTCPVTDRYHRKQSRDIGRLALGAGGQGVVVYLKRHYEAASRRPRRHYASPARREYDRVEWVRGQGVRVPRVLAGGERVVGDQRESFLAIEELAGMLALHELIPLAAGALAPEPFADWKRGLGREVARLGAELHRRGAFHQDLYLCHFYAAVADVHAPPGDWAGRVALIDFHRLARARGPRAAWLRVKDLAQLRFSAVGVAGLGDADVRAAFGHYRSLTGVGAFTRGLAAWKAGRYLAHNAKKSH